MSIKWDHIGQPEFDRFVEALVHRLYDATATVRAVNGRGGDRGIDIEVRQGSRLRIYQLKYYPDGLTGRGRRNSVKVSFDRAMAHDPYEWVLVVPCTLTTPENEFVHGLADGRSVKVHVMNRAELDDRFAAHRDLESYLTRDNLKEDAKIYGQERATLMGGLPDVNMRVRELGQVMDRHLDCDWALDFSRQGDEIVHTLRAKHPRAHETSPITLKITGRNGGMSTDIAAAVRRTIGFGTREEITLPPEAVQRLTVQGPDWLAQDLSDVSVSWQPAGPAPLEGEAAELVFLDADDAVIASYSGKMNSVGAASLGRSVDMNVLGSTLRLLIPHNTATAAQLTFSFRLGEKDTATALKLLALQRRLLIGGAFQIRVNDRTAGAGQLPDTSTPDQLSQIKDLQLYVEDLDVVQRHCERHFPLPDDITSTERITLRIARLLIGGRCVITPFTRSLTLTLNGTDSSVLRMMLNGDPHSFIARMPTFPISVAGHELDLGPIRLFHTRAIAVDTAQALAALNNGDGAGAMVTVEPQEGERYRLFLEDSPDDGRPLLPSPLNLPGFPEPH